MGFLKNIFGKKDVVVEEVQEQIYDLPGIEVDLICSECNMAIHPGQRIKTFAGKKMHMKPCWFKLRKFAKSQM